MLWFGVAVWSGGFLALLLISVALELNAVNKFYARAPARAGAHHRACVSSAAAILSSLKAIVRAWGDLRP